MELVPLKDLIELLRASGVTTYKDGDLELVLGAAPVSKDAGEETSRDEVVEKALKEMDILPGPYAKLFTVTAKGGI